MKNMLGLVFQESVRTDNGNDDNRCCTALADLVHPGKGRCFSANAELYDKTTDINYCIWYIKKELTT